MPFTTVLIDGGLDLSTSPQAVKPGRLTDCKNYEVARLRGLRRIDGYELYDGGQSPSFVGSGPFIELRSNGFFPGDHRSAYNAGNPATININLNVGTHITVTGTISLNQSTYNGVNTTVDVIIYLASGQTSFLTGIDTPQINNTSLTVPAQGAIGVVFWPGGAGVSLFSYSFPAVSAELSALSQTFSTASALIQPVPGQGNVNGLFWLKNRLYATRDFITMSFNSGTMLPDPGDLVLQGGTSLATCTWAGYVINSSVTAPSLSSGTATGVVTFASTLTYNGAGVVTANDTKPNGGAVYRIAPDGSVTNLFSIVGTTTANAAGLYVALGGRGLGLATKSWQQCDLGWSLVYKSCTTDFIDMNFATVQQQASPQAVATNWKTATTGSGGAWGLQDPSSVGWPAVLSDLFAVDSAYAYWNFSGNTVNAGSGTNTLYTDTVTLTGFGFTDADIPAAASITGVEIKITGGGQWQNTAGQTVGNVLMHDYSITLLGTSQVDSPNLSGNQYPISAVVTNTPTTYGNYSVATFDYGAPPAGGSAPLDKLGYARLSQSDVTNANFGLTFRASYKNPVTPPPVVYHTATAGSGGTLATGFYRTVVLANTPTGLTTWANVTGVENNTNVTAGRLTVNWPVFTGATGYRVYVSPLNGASGSENNYFNITSGSTTQQVINSLPVSGGAIPAQGFFGFNASGPAQNASFMLDRVQMRVSYLPVTNGIYFWDTQSTTKRPAVTDGVWTGNTHTITSNTIAFTTGDVGKTFSFVSGGITRTGIITVVNSATSVTVAQESSIPGITVSGATLTVYSLPVRAQVVMHYQQGGLVSAGSARGVLYFQLVQSDGTVGGVPVRPITINDAIRSWPANGLAPDGGLLDNSTQFSLIDSGITINTLDCSAAMQGVVQPDNSTAPPSKYQSITKNFYAQSNLEAIYGVSGAGPAFFYDGIKTSPNSGKTVPGNFCRILTGVPVQYDTPRGICAHQGHIVLRYYAGTVQWSNALNVLSFDNTKFDKTASQNAFAEPVNEIASINGDALLVGCRSAVYTMNGNLSSPSTVYQHTTSPTTGIREYTLQPMTQYTYCDFRGITTIATTNAYGDFLIGHLSDMISPWLIPRVQLSSFFESGNTGVINSYLCRNKNQYRMCFADGWQVTMTYLSEQEPPQFTFQYFTKADGSTPLTLDVVQAFTEVLGRDRIFVASNDGTGNVYEMDRGNTFNGLAFPASFTLVPDTAQMPYQNKLFSGINVFGQAQDYATFSLSRSANYDKPAQGTGVNTITETLGAATAAATGVITPFRSFGTSALQIEGSAVNLRFDSNGFDPTNTFGPQFPHFVQAISYDIEPLQENTQ